MRVIYQPEIRADDIPAAIGFFVGPAMEIVRIEPHKVVDIRDDHWRMLEREPGVAALLAEGTLRPA